MKFLQIANQLTQNGDAFIERFGTNKFHEEATDLLLKSRIHEAFSIEEILGMALKVDRSTAQNFKALEFSDLPLTVSSGKKCFIDLYFWRRRPTTIHNHHFSGAFMGLLGKNVDLEYTFTPTRKIGSFHELGELKLNHERSIGPGNVVTIAPLDGFIHQNHHQADLTVNLCFRTPDFNDESLSGFLYSGLRYTKNSQLLSRVERIKRFLDFGPIEASSLDIDEALAFYLQHEDSRSSHPRFLSFLDKCHERILSEERVSLVEQLQNHRKKFEELEDRYE